MEMMVNALNWFEIPVVDFDRAREFYSRVFDYDMPVSQMGSKTMGFLLHEQGKGIGGAIVKDEEYLPSREGALIYLNAGSDLTPVLSRVREAGGEILLAKTSVGPHLGFYALFLDSEGNRLALHSMN